MPSPGCRAREALCLRGEEELSLRELKSHLHGRDCLLDAQTPDTAAQVVLAMLLGCLTRRHTARRGGAACGRGNPAHQYRETCTRLRRCVN